MVNYSVLQNKVLSVACRAKVVLDLLGEQFTKKKARKLNIQKYVPHVQHDCFCYSSNSPCFLAFSIFKVFFYF